MDITEHPTGTGKVYLAVVLDAWSRRVVGWSIADHLRAELVADAVQMAVWRRQPPKDQTIAHSDHGSQGGIKGLSQHLEMEVLRDVQARACGGDPGDARDDLVAGSAVDGEAGAPGRVLEGDRTRADERGRCRRGEDVIRVRHQVVPERWWHATSQAASAVTPLSVLR